MKTLFCNKCHKRIVPPTFLKQMEGKIQGKMKINCGDTTYNGWVYVKYLTMNLNNSRNFMRYFTYTLL